MREDIVAELGKDEGREEGGHEGTGTWRRVHCRNGWEVEMVPGGEAGND